METLTELLESCVRRYADRPALGLRRDDGTIFTLDVPRAAARSRIAAWRLGCTPWAWRRGIGPDLVASTPAPAGDLLRLDVRPLIFVPLDARMAADAVARISNGRARSADPRQRPRRTRPARGGAGPLPHDPRRRPDRGPGRTFRRTGNPLEAWERPNRTRSSSSCSPRARPAPQGRDAVHGKRAGRRPVVPRDHPADGAPDRVAAAAVAPPRSRRYACTTRSTSGQTSCTCAAGKPAGHLRRHPRAPGHTMLLVPRSWTCSGARSSARWRSRAGRPRSTGCAGSPAGCRCAPAAGCSAASTSSFWRRPAAVRDRRRVPAAGTPAGLGGPGRHRAPRVRGHRDGGRRLHDDGRPPAGLRRVAAQAGRDAHRRRREIQFRGPTLFRGYGDDPEATAAG